MNGELFKSIVYLFVGLSLLLFGMRLMSIGLKKVMGSGIKKFFNKTRNNPLVSMGIGILVTLVVRTSDATNAMVIGFVNSGAMSVYQGISVMLGAYIGTTSTGVLASFSSFQFSSFFLLFSFIGTILLFIKNDKVKSIGEFLTGFGLLFFGLDVMKDAFLNSDLTSFCQNMFAGIDYGIVLFLIGVLVTAVIQSSSAVTVIVLAMVGGGALGFSSGLYIVLGATLGTVTTELLMSSGGNVQGKRIAVIAFTLRALASIVALTLLMIFESQISSFVRIFAINGSDELPVAMFVVIYNVIFMPLLIPLIKPFTKLFNKLIKDKEKDELSKAIHFIDDKLLVSPPLAMMQVKKEILNMFDLAYENYLHGYRKIVLKENTNDKIIVASEDKIDYLNARITDFLIKLSSKAEPKEEKVIGAYFHVINDIERIGDHSYNFYETAVKMKGEDMSFSPLAVVDLSQINDIVEPMFALARNIFDSENAEGLSDLHAYEDKTDELKTRFFSNHYERIKSNQCSSEMTQYFATLISELERVADHLTNIGFSIVNPTGDEENTN
ncbi:MAG: Na/Pi symporter [Bacilli bacterium]|nr:Na/Pi symporter [Bacilli bacterium]